MEGVLGGGALPHPSAGGASLSMVPPSAECKPSTSPWIIGPVADVLFCCGGLVWILSFAQGYLIDEINPRWAPTFASVTILASHLFGEAHISATLFKIYRTAETRSRFAFCTLWQPIFWTCLCLYGIANPPVTGGLLKLYLLWVYQHFSGQAYGLVLLYCFKRNYEITQADKLTLRYLLSAVTVVAIAKQLSVTAVPAPEFLGVALPTWNFLPSTIHFACVWLSYGWCLVFGLRLFVRGCEERRILPLPALLILITILVAYLGDEKNSNSLWLYLPAFFHATQYLAITVVQHLKDSVDSSTLPTSKESVKLRGLKYYSNLLLLSVGLYVGIPMCLHLCGAPRDLAFASVFAVVNLHHFATDMLIWKMRNPETRNRLL